MVPGSSVPKFAQHLLLTGALMGYLLLTVFSTYWLGELTHHTFGADFTIYYEAYQDARNGGDPYEPYRIGGSYVNHPFVLTLVSALDWTRQAGVTLAFWVGLSLLAWIGCLYLVPNLLTSSPFGRFFQDSGLGWVLWLFLGLGFGPFWETLQIGQINMFVILAILLAFWFSEKEQAPAAGLFLALAVVLKTSPLLLGIYFLLRGQWRVVMWTGIFFGLATLGPALQFSPRIVFQYLNVVSQVGGEIHPSFYNQSMLSIVFRGREFLGLEDGAASFLVLGHKILMGATLLATSLVGYWKLRAKALDRLWWYSLYVLCMVIFSPLVWYHHSVYLLLPLAALFVRPTFSRIGVVCLFLFQIERVFDWFIRPVALPVLFGHLILLLVMLGTVARPNKNISSSNHDYSF